jgi:hypothetical protein
MDTQKNLRILALVSKTLLGLFALWFIGAYIYIAIHRMAYPFELEWMEGGSLLEVARILRGRGLYAPPTLEYIPYIYPPLYYYTSASFAKILGLSFTPLRLVSFLASIGCFSILYLTICQETHSRFLAFLGMGFFAATFRISGAWFDIARVDTLFLLFLLIGIYFIALGRPTTSIIAGIAFALSFLSKQTAILTIAIIFLFYLITKRREAIWSIISFGIFASSIMFIENIRSTGWFNYYVFTLPANHKLNPNWPLLLVFYFIFFIQPVFIAFAIGVAKILLEFRSVLKETRYLYYIVIAGALIATSLLSKANPGGYDNVLMPGYAGLSLIFPLGLSWFHSQFQKYRSAVRNSLFIYTICILQFGMLVYDVNLQIPTKADYAAGQRLLAAIQQINGEVWIPADNYLSQMTGKNSYANRNAILEVYGSFGRQDTQNWNDIQKDINQRLSEHGFSAVIVNVEKKQNNVIEIVNDGFLSNVYQTYNSNTLKYGDTGAFWPITGWPTKPGIIFYVP